MADPLIVRITVDDAPLQRTIGDLKALSLAFPELIQTLVEGGEGFQRFIEIHRDPRPTVRTDEQRILLQPSQWLLGYVAALLALQRQHEISEEVGHTKQS